MTVQVLYNIIFQAANWLWVKVFTGDLKQNAVGLIN